HLPNELLTTILGNIKIQELIHLRVVCTRWLAVIESLCQLKPSLLLTNKEEYLMYHQRWLDPNDFTKIELKHDQERRSALNLSETTLSPDFCTLLMKLFSNIQCLAIEIGIGYESFNANSLFSLLDHWKSKLTTLVLK